MHRVTPQMVSRRCKIGTPDTPVCLFSASKMITAMLIHMLDERGDLNLLDPISYYIPEYGVNGKRRATIFHLLSHRGGFHVLIQKSHQNFCLTKKKF